MLVMFLGDVHGNLHHLYKAIEYCKLHNVKQILQLGDFGFWEQTKLGIQFLNETNIFLTNSNIKLDFIDGNHENHNILRDGRYPLENGKRQIRSNISHLERGTVHLYGNSKVAALGGAWSIDKKMRTDGFDWFDTEEATLTDVEKFDGLKADILMSHDAPMAVNLNEVCLKVRGYEYKPYIEGQNQRLLIQKAINMLGVKDVYHGHHHMRYKTKLSNGVTVTGLDCDGSLEDSWVIKDI